MRKILQKVIVNCDLGFGVNVQTNCYILKYSKDDLALIDPGGQYERIREEMEKLGGTLRIVILTHGHPDHWLGLPDLFNNGEKFEILYNQADHIFFTEKGIQDLTKYYLTEFLSQNENNDRTKKEREIIHRIWDKLLKTITKRVLEKVKLLDVTQIRIITNNVYAINLPIGNNNSNSDRRFKLHVLHTPGHSEGSISLYTKEAIEYNRQIFRGVIFSGDLLFYKELENTYVPYSNINALHRSISHLLFNNINIKDYFWVFPGHKNSFAIRLAKKLYLTKIFDQKKELNQLAFS